ncbi:MAG TPA: hypothetical protein VFI95_01110 [Terriglobales bacterium]|nr:hypothetical protein [Terriglobales bacterium]
MGGFIEPRPTAAEQESNWRPVLIGIVIVVVVVGAIVFALREKPKQAKAPPPYAANLKISSVKLDAAQNFVGATVSYVDGTIANIGDKTVNRAMVRVLFKDEIGQVVGDETMPIRVLQTSGPYPDAFDLSASPLGPGQSKPFRLTFESISAQWNRQAPEIRIVDVTTK